MISKNYILIYYQQIKDGSVTVGRWIERWYEYIVHGLEEKRFFFDQKKAARAIAFIQQYCRHHEGKFVQGFCPCSSFSYKWNRSAWAFRKLRP